MTASEPLKESIWQEETKRTDVSLGQCLQETNQSRFIIQQITLRTTILTQNVCNYDVNENKETNQQLLSKFNVIVSQIQQAAAIQQDIEWIYEKKCFIFYKNSNIMSKTRNIFKISVT